MNICRITAIFDEFALEKVEEILTRHCVKTFTLYPVKGRGRYFDNFNEDRMIDYVKMEIYVNEENSIRLAKLIVDAAHVNIEGEGLVSISPVDELLWIRCKRTAVEADFPFNE